MRLQAGELAFSATDLSSFLGCRQRTALDMAVALGHRRPVFRSDPMLDLLRQRGQDHERRYVEQLRAGGRELVELSAEIDEDERVERTLAAMRGGADGVVQGALRDGDWGGRPDVLLRVPGQSELGEWSYEVHDTKLARETKAGTILQLCIYSELLARAQGATPRRFHVVTPDADAPRTSYRFDEYAAYARFVRTWMGDATAIGDDRLAAENYPEPVEQCDVCRWSGECASKRRRDDHLSLVAGISRAQRRELESRTVPTLTALAGLPEPLPFKPRRGSTESYERVRDQARVQLESRGAAVPVFEVLRVEPGKGLCRLPDPTPGDLFVDLEGDPMAAEHGREYLFGVAAADDEYRWRWAFSDAEERSAFEWLVDAIVDAQRAHPTLHVYHYSPYEPGAFKRLAGRYATRERELDTMLRAGTFVDLLGVVRQSIRAGVERYSIKALEPLFGYRRRVPLDVANEALRAMEYALGSGIPDSVPAEARETIAGYNRDDCVSTRALRDWLESVRAREREGGSDIPRPAPATGEARAELDERAQRVEVLRTRLLAGIPDSRDARTDEQQGRWLLAYLLDYHRREDKAVWWEYYRLVELPEEELYDERAAVAGLEFVERVDRVLNTKTHRPTGSVVDRYRFPAQEMEIEPGASLRLQDGTTFGQVVALDRVGGTIDVRKGPARAEVHPRAAFEFSYVGTDEQAASLSRIGETVAEHGDGYRAARALLGREPPRLAGEAFGLRPGMTTADYAARIIGMLDETVLPIQGPPGTGKTYLGARLICRLVAEGRRVGVTANSHEVIVQLLDEVAAAAREAGLAVALGHKGDEGATVAGRDGVRFFDSNDAARAALASGEVNVLGGTAWLWCRAEMAGSVDVLVIDEAGQMTLANAVAVSPAARSLVLLGDPQQLEQPRRGSHPDGVAVSALEHLLGEHRTMPRARGLFLPVTRRLAPAICEFTSEVFYESRLIAAQGLSRQRLVSGGLPIVGLGLVTVEHDGNRNHSIEEIDVVAGLIERLCRDGTSWIESNGAPRPMEPSEILVVAPYNAQVARLAARLSKTGARIGTVDKFQGKEAAVVIYSMATSRPEDAPRGMEFLFSRNRLNVATSRARCLAIVVASPRLFEVECRSPRQMQLANALCRFRELAAPIAAVDSLAR